MEEPPFNYNSWFVKYFVLLLAAPFWVPFMKKIWAEIENALREEGGVFGRAPTPAELEEIRRQKRYEEDPLVNEPFVRGVPRAAAAARNKEKSSSPGGSKAAPGKRRAGGGFGGSGFGR